jgi:hypothetical protein
MLHVAIRVNNCAATEPLVRKRGAEEGEKFTTLPFGGAQISLDVAVTVHTEQRRKGDLIFTSRWQRP